MPEAPEVATRCERFIAEQSAAWADMVKLLETVRDAFPRCRGDAAEGETFQEGIRRLQEDADALFLNAYARYVRCCPPRRALSAIEELDSLLGPAASLRRSGIDGAMQRLLARAGLRLRDPWILYRTAELKQLRETGTKSSQAGEWAEWTSALDRDRQTAERLLARYRDWCAKASAAVPETRPSRKKAEACRRNAAFWWRCRRAVAASLESEARLMRLMIESFEITARSLSDLRLERADLRKTLQARIGYLRSWTGGSYDPPDTGARIVSPEERLDAWQTRIDRAVQSHLPEEVETTEPRWAKPSALARWRTVRPRQAYRHTLRQSSKPLLAAGMREAVERNLALAREMKHADEVILYGQGMAREGGDELLGEALENARTLLEQCDAATPAETPGLDAAARTALMTAGVEAGATLEVGRAGVLALITRRQGRHLILQSRSLTRRYVDRAVSRLGAASSALAAKIQVRLGWKLPARPPLPPVVHRIQLREAMDLEAATRELPALYRRLFRLSPVDDLRFLVGRDEELRGFQQALDAWRAGHFAACLLIGARGSGKTSLLNCAISSLFADETVVRAQFSERLAGPGDMERFVAALPASPRRIVVLEEIERSFLKSFNGFGAVRRLQELIQATASTTLWILAMNDFAFQLLDQAARLGGSFSHRINAMSVLREDLIKAILQRHNLSGLRLNFAPPPPGDPRVHRVRAFVGIRDNPEKMFFDSLYDQSGGVFRSAFELWQSSIQRVEAGKVEMKQPLEPDFGPLRRELDQRDHFALLSIQQHGSLTADELSRVLLEPEPSGRLRMERLAALDLLAADPGYPGMRVRPEAQLFVNDLLQRVNLI